MANTAVGDCESGDGVPRQCQVVVGKKTTVVAKRNGDNWQATDHYLPLMSREEALKAGVPMLEP